MKCKLCKRTDIKKKSLGLCSIHYARDYRKKNKDKIRPVAQARYLRHREKNLKRLKEWKKNNMKRLNELRTKYYYEDREKMIIRQRTRYHFGHLKKQRGCEICGSKDKLEFHHEEPYEYDKFKILCPDCHAITEGRLLIKSNGDAVLPKLNEGERK